MSYLPADLLTSERAKNRRLKVESQTLAASAAARGTGFTGFTSRIGVDISAGDDDYYGVFSTTDKWAVIVDVVVNIDFSGVSDGQFSHVISAYVDKSNGNEWSYTPSAPLPAGRALNSFYVNDFPKSVYDAGVSANVISGNPDYYFFFEDYYLDQTGNRQTISSTRANFFEKGAVFIPPNSDMLVYAKSSGGALGSADIKTFFLFLEMTNNEIGITP